MISICIDFKGDSGSPLFKLVNGIFHVHAIYSFGTRVCEYVPTRFSVATNLNFYRKWIEDNTK